MKETKLNFGKYEFSNQLWNSYEKLLDEFYKTDHLSIINKQLDFIIENHNNCNFSYEEGVKAVRDFHKLSMIDRSIWFLTPSKNLEKILCYYDPNEIELVDESKGEFIFEKYIEKKLSDEKFRELMKRDAEINNLNKE